MQYGIPQKRPNRRDDENKCKITIKRKKDGTVEKSISGNCTKDQLRALSENSKEKEEWE